MTYLSPEEAQAAVEAKGTKFATVKFVKKDGTTRVKNGLFKPLSHIKGTGRKTPKGYVSIYSPSEKKWGMFALNKVLEVK
jgi:hypothetical protein